MPWESVSYLGMGVDGGVCGNGGLQRELDALLHGQQGLLHVLHLDERAVHVVYLHFGRLLFVHASVVVLFEEVGLLGCLEVS